MQKDKTISTTSLIFLDTLHLVNRCVVLWFFKLFQILFIYFYCFCKPQCVGIRYKIQIHVLDVLKEELIFFMPVFFVVFALPVCFVIWKVFNAAFVGVRGSCDER